MNDLRNGMNDVPDTMEQSFSEVKMVPDMPGLEKREAQYVWDIMNDVADGMNDVRDTIHYVGNVMHYVADIMNGTPDLLQCTGNEPLFGGD